LDEHQKQHPLLHQSQKVSLQTSVDSMQLAVGTENNPVKTE